MAGTVATPQFTVGDDEEQKPKPKFTVGDADISNEAEMAANPPVPKPSIQMTAASPIVGGLEHLAAIQRAPTIDEINKGNVAAAKFGADTMMGNVVAKPLATLAQTHAIPALKATPWLGKIVTAIDEAPGVIGKISRGATVGGATGGVEGLIRGKGIIGALHDAGIGALTGGALGGTLPLIDRLATIPYPGMRRPVIEAEPTAPTVQAPVTVATPAEPAPFVPPRATPTAPPNVSGEVTPIGRIENPRLLGTRGTGGVRTTPAGLLPAPGEATVPPVSAPEAAQAAPSATIAPVSAPVAPEAPVGTAGERPQYTYKPSEKAATMSAPTRDLGPEFNEASWKAEIDRNKKILANSNVSGTQREIAEARLRDAEEGLARVASGGKNIPDVTPATPKPTVDSVVNQATGVKPLQVNVPIREQLRMTPPETATTTETDPLKAKYPDPAVRQMVRANGEKIVQAVGDNPETMKAVHDLTRVDLRQALINSGEDMGQTTVSNSKFAGEGSIPREEAFNRLLQKGHTPEDIVKLAKATPSQTAEDYLKSLGKEAPEVENVNEEKGPNASGESAASKEAISRVKGEKARGEQRFKIDTRSNREIPLHGVDAVDATPGEHEVIVKRGPNGETVLDRGAKANYRPKPARKG